MKTFTFWAIVVLVSGVTLYILATTISSHVLSFTRGPAHWHADFEIWACDQLVEIAESKFLSNKVGSSTIHHHNDYRLHIEGVVKDKNDVVLKNTFRTMGIFIAKDSLTVPLKSGVEKTWKNGDVCGKGKKGKWHLFINGKEASARREREASGSAGAEPYEKIKDFENYLIAPETNVPPGDRLKFIFSEKSVVKLDPFISREKQ